MPEIAELLVEKKDGRAFWFYVYTLIDPRDGKIFYVGKGRHSRIFQHENDAKRGKKSKRCDRIREIWAAGLMVDARIVGLFYRDTAARRHELSIIHEIGYEHLLNETRVNDMSLYR